MQSSPVRVCGDLMQGHVVRVALDHAVAQSSPTRVRAQPQPLREPVMIGEPGVLVVCQSEEHHGYLNSR